jgi:CDP-diacylglycerol pyrophosphatase
LLRENVPNYWEAAWDARRFVEEGAHRQLPRDRIGMAINSAASRKFYREFYENRAVWRKSARKNAAKSVSSRKITLRKSLEGDDDTLLAAALTAPPSLSGLTEAEAELLRGLGRNRDGRT